MLYPQPRLLLGLLCFEPLAATVHTLLRFARRVPCIHQGSYMGDLKSSSLMVVLCLRLLVVLEEGVCRRLQTLLVLGEVRLEVLVLFVLPQRLLYMHQDVHCKTAPSTE